MASFVFSVRCRQEERFFENVLNAVLVAADDYVSVCTSANSTGLIKTINTECRSAKRAMFRCMNSELKHA